MNHKKRQLLKHAEGRSRVISTLRITDSIYDDMLFERAYCHLNNTYKDFPEFISTLTSSKLFWNWWKNQYYNTDIEFINEVQSGNAIFSLSKNDFEQYYKSKHLNKNIKIDYYIIESIAREQHEMDVKEFSKKSIIKTNE